MSAQKNKLITDLSGGERQRVFIGRALVARPKILILDEPTVGVDAGSQDKFYGFLHKLNKKYGITIVFVTHDIDVITAEAQTVLCLNSSLVCNMKSRDFSKKSYLEKVYGTQVKLVHHEH